MDETACAWAGASGSAPPAPPHPSFLPPYTLRSAPADQVAEAVMRVAALCRLSQLMTCVELRQFESKLMFTCFTLIRGL